MEENYQPVMIKTLLENGGKASKQMIIEALQKYNPSKDLSTLRDSEVFEVLAKTHKLVHDEGNEYILDNFHKLAQGQRNQLVDICAFKIFSKDEQAAEKLVELIKKRAELLGLKFNNLGVETEVGFEITEAKRNWVRGNILQSKMKSEKFI